MDKVFSGDEPITDSSSDPEKVHETQETWWHRTRRKVRRSFTLPKVQDVMPIYDASRMIPEASAGFFSLLWFSWITPILVLGYARPLEAKDLYKLQDDRASDRIANIMLESFERRRKEAQEYNVKLERGEIKPGLRIIWWTICGSRTRREKAWRETDGKRRASLVLAMNDSVKWFFWTGGFLQVISDAAQVVNPLIVKRIIAFASDSYSSYQTGQPPPSIGLGIGLSFVLFALLLISSWCTHHHYYRAMGSGALLGGGLITAIYSRALRFTPRSRAAISSRLVNHISTDVSRINYCMGCFHPAWTSMIQLIICLILLLINLGPSALAGFALLVVMTPMNTFAAKRLFAFRLKSMKWTDSRSKSLQEIISGIKIIKFFSWEMPFLKRITKFRRLEMGYLRTLIILRALLFAISTALPQMASVMAFITYSLLGHPIDAATIFSSLALFQLLRISLIMLPTSISAISDAATACERLYEVFDAETSNETLVQNPGLDIAVKVEGASFSWDNPSPQDSTKTKCDKKGESDKSTPKSFKTPQKVYDSANIFKIKAIDMEIPRGQLVAIVGAVGVGKTSLLQGLTGEMRRTGGTVEFGGTVSYCAQSAWIQNVTIRENICFGRPFEEERYWKAVRDACLEADLRILPNYDLTEVGEKGVTLSGGQKQRVSICRALYCDADIQIFDDPLSALDAHVGRDVFFRVFKNVPTDKTRILVTHALHFLPEVDYIYTIVDGQIAEHGTYHDLMANDGAFAKLVHEFGSKDKPSTQSDEVKKVDSKKSTRTHSVKGRIMMQEERNIGAVGWRVYQQYLSAGRGVIFMPLLFLSLVLFQGLNVLSSYWLVYWGELKWHLSTGVYTSIYAVLGLSQATATFFLGAVVSFLSYYASQQLYERAFHRVLHAPMSFFETMPLGRIMNCFAKDIDNIDNLLGDALSMLASAGSQILGSAIIISIILPWFLIVVLAALSVYCYIAMFYRANARELRRLDAILRGSLYSHFSESLSGLTTIRAYGEIDRFKRENHGLVDIENRAYWLTVANQRWLGIRVDFLGIILTFSAALLTVATRFTISPGETGLVLSYILSLQQSFTWAIRQFAALENSMTSVERIVYYAEDIEQEAPHYVDKVTVPVHWPSEGRIVLRDVVMKYRPELPPVLRGLNMAVIPREKIGIVGRTGAGKSSIMTVLFRIVELSSGSIEIDDVDISQVGLSRLRKGISIIPQDAFLFSGTLRTNLDPFGLCNDAHLWDALRRAYLVESSRDPEPSLSEGPPNDLRAPGSRFTLDSPIEEEGANLSIGQRSLVSLARALVNDAKILVLDEATASVDYETDRKIQDTIASEFKDRTILCIAHRLHTIISYDRICVIDDGTIAEFDTPTNLFAIQNGIFRGMCETSSIALDDIISASERARS